MISDAKIELLMAELGRSGITVILKFDHERSEEGGEPWTLVMSGPALAEVGYIRSESSRLDELLDQGISRLREQPGDWEWLGEFA